VGDHDAKATQEISAASAVDDTVTVAHAPEQIPTKRKTTPDVATGQRRGRYVILRELGAGGMSVVYAAYDPELDRQVALKLMRPVADSKTQTAERLLREAQALARLAHPHVVHVYDVGIVEGEVYVAMEFIDGVTLAEWIKSEKRPWRRILEVLDRAGQGLAAAHAAGLVHLDFKPGNVLIGNDGRVRVVDFGLARRPRSSGSIGGPEDSIVSSDDTSREDSQRRSHLDVQLTEVGVVIGTPGYMAPEQLRAEVVDDRADQFAFCVTAYKCFFGKLPFPRRGDQLIRRIRNAEVEVGRQRGVPGYIRRALMRGLRFEASERYGSMTDLLTALSPRRHDRGRAVAAVGVLTGAAAIGVSLSDRGVDCDRGSEDIAVSWAPEKRAAIASSFAASELPHATSLWEKVESDLEAWSQRWAEQYRDACEATHVRKEQTPELLGQRMLCLRRHRNRFDALLTVLEEADQQTIGRVDNMLETLPSPASCAQSSELDLMADLDEETKAKVLEVDALVAKGIMQQASGRFQPGLELVRQANAMAEEAGHRPTEVWAKATLGQALEASGKYEEGLATMNQAVWEAEELGLDDIRLDMYGRLAFLLGYQLARFDEAEWFAAAATHLSLRLDAPPSDRARLLLNQAAVADRTGDYNKELKLAQEALSMREQAGLPEDSQQAMALSYLGNSLYNLGRYAEALQQYRKAKRITQGRMGRLDPSTAGIWENIGNSLRGMGDLQGALEAQQEATEIWEQLGESAEHHLGPALNNLGTVYSDLEQYDEAVEVFEQSASVMRTSGEGGTPTLGIVLINASEAHLKSGDLDRALERCRQARQILEDTLHPEHLFVGAALAICGHVFVALGDDDEALQHLTRARQILAGEGADPLTRGEAELYWAMATARRHPERMDEVRVAAERARTTLESIAPRGAHTLRELEDWAAGLPKTE
jgi:serine/threonine protein kinase/tetratricopeptide (TPR) repeat protein